MQLQDSTKPLAHVSNTDAAGHWPARLSALTCLRDRYIAEGWSAREAAELALLHLDSKLEVQAAAEAKLAASRAKARAKAEYHLAGGLVIRRAPDGAWLVPSGTRGGVIHRVSEQADCSCEAGQAQRPCWHVEAVLLVSAAPTPPPAPAAVDRLTMRVNRVAELVATARARQLAQAA